ncbi:EAL domain-containing protein [Novispirillum sp. DQ9]|uniref:EAL domain-containing response regulator n=1 Tax=Novispirillum sp. DQ9 TaxID=3398612 RepID=UPI003C7B0744
MIIADSIIKAARILVVDDNPANVALLEALLDEEGFENVTGITDPRQVVPQHTAEPFDIILLDIRMPHMDGHEVLRRLHEVRADGDYVPVLVLTAQTDAETRLKALESGARDFVTKPFIREEVMSRIRNMLEVRALYTERTRQNALLEELVAERTGRLKAIMDNAPDVILATDGAGVITEFNHAGSQTFHDDMTGRPLADLFLDGTALPDTGAAEVTARRPDDTAFPMELSIAPLRADGGAERVVIGRDITKRKLLEEELTWLAGHDPVTELPSRFAVRRAIEQRLGESAGGEGGTVVAVLLSGHRRLADLFGAAAAEKLLRQMGEAAEGLLAPDGGVLGAWGDAMLVAFAPGARDGAAAERLARALRGALEGLWQVDGREVAMTCRIGAALAPEHGGTADTLVRRAALAASARGASPLFTEALEAEAAEWHRLEGALRGALERDELRLLYQPKVELASGRMTGVEALMRWHHGEMGMVSPVRFIPIAEETGLIDAFGAWAVRQAARDAAAWGGLKVAVNVSVRQLGKPTLMEAVREVIAAGMDPASLELEVTESAVMDNVEDAIAALHRLRDLGVGLAIDDFGTGYSSLAYLSRLPLTTLKIDQSFVRGLGERPESTAIVDMVLGLARALNLNTVAEGIETPEHAAILTRAGCVLGQGWLYARPLPAAEISGRLSAVAVPA